MLEFFQSLVSANLPGLGQKDLLKLLVDPVLAPSGASIHKQGRASIAKCVAALVVTQSPGNISFFFEKSIFDFDLVEYDERKILPKLIIILFSRSSNCGFAIRLLFEAK